MKWRDLANKLCAVVAALCLALMPLFAVVPSDYVVAVQLGATWTVDPPYQNFNNGTILDDLGINAYNDYLRELNQTTPLPEVVVAVIDSGLNVGNPVFTDRVVTEYARNFNPDAGDADAWNVDLLGHGSHVAGLIVDSTLPNIKVLPVKIFVGTENELVSGTVIEDALNYVIQVKKLGVNIVAVNLSLGTPTDAYDNNYATYAYYQSYINALRNVNILPIVAAGNGNPYGTGTAYSLPSACKGAVAVSAYNQFDDNKLADFSNYGPHISLTAPGVEIMSAGKTALGSRLQIMSGTSMATPFVSLCYAMLMSDVSKTTAATLGVEWQAGVDKYAPYYYLNPQHKALLLKATDLGPAGNDVLFGYGAVNVAQFAVAPEEIPLTPSKTEDELNPEIVTPTPTPTTDQPLAYIQNVFWVLMVIIVLIIIVSALRYHFTGGRKDESA